MNVARDRHRREAGTTPGVRSLTTMSPLIRFMSWISTIGNGGATANAWRAIEERAQADAAVDALSARMNLAPSNNIAPANKTAPSRAA